jgi:hypothetical protein
LVHIHVDWPKTAVEATAQHKTGRILSIETLVFIGGEAFDFFILFLGLGLLIGRCYSERLPATTPFLTRVHTYTHP